jgi:cytochrome c553
VKENYTPDATLAGVTVMHKVQGYDGDHSDWYWAKYDAAGTAEASGRVASCAVCHGQRADRDYIMTAPPGD